MTVKMFFLKNKNDNKVEKDFFFTVVKFFPSNPSAVIIKISTIKKKPKLEGHILYNGLSLSLVCLVVILESWPFCSDSAPC